jgi:ribosomal protein L6P/L9E
MYTKTNLTQNKNKSNNVNNINFNAKASNTSKSELINTELGLKLPHFTIFNNNDNMVLTNLNKSITSTQFKLLNNNILSTFAPFTKVFIIRGIGYQADIIEDVLISPEFSHSRYLSLRVGHSFLIFKPIPNYVGVKVYKKERKLVIYGASKEQVANFSKVIFKLRTPSVYTGRGIRIKKGLHRRKLGKKDIRKGKV